METIGHLNCVRGSTGGAVSVDPTPITADDFLSGMRLQPGSQAISGAVRQQVNGSVRFEIDQNGPIALTFAPCPIVNAESPRAPDLYEGSRFQSAKNGIGA